jgi:predicted DNA-binding transcriptional regulator AlpA
MNTECESYQGDSAKGQDRLLNQNEVAAILCLSPKTLEYYRWKGGGPNFVKMGKLVRYRESEVQRYIQSLEKGI